jgi:hypothetical protein
MRSVSHNCSLKHGFSFATIGVMRYHLSPPRIPTTSIAAGFTSPTRPAQRHIQRRQRPDRMRAPHDRNDGVAFDGRQVVVGILSGADARPLVDAGVAPMQLYSGLINRGLALIRDCADGLQDHR